MKDASKVTEQKKMGRYNVKVRGDNFAYMSFGLDVKIILEYQTIL